MIDEFDIAIVGAGAAGLAAAIFAGEAARVQARVALLDGAKKPGAKILVSGGGRCNVTNAALSEKDYAGGPQPIIRNVLRAFDEQRTLTWMRGMGVDLKLEPTGKYFPVTDSARTVLDALLRRVADLGIDQRFGVRITDVAASERGFDLLQSDNGIAASARRVIIATGGLALPKSGSDGRGLEWMRRLGHSIIEPTPALAPLILAPDDTPGGRFAELSGISFDARLAMHAREKLIHARVGSVLFTHFGLSGPAAMDMSRHIARYRLESGGALPEITLGHPLFSNAEAADTWLLERTRQNPKRSPAAALSELYPERFAQLIAAPHERLATLSRADRLGIARRMAALPLPVTGDRGYSFAEATAGGVDLREVDARTMQSRIVPGLFLCGEILDVDGRIGGFNFQWAWASGYLAGRGAIASLGRDND